MDGTLRDQWFATFTLKETLWAGRGCPSKKAAREDVASTVIADIDAGLFELEGGGDQVVVDGDVAGEHGEMEKDVGDDHHVGEVDDRGEDSHGSVKKEKSGSGNRKKGGCFERRGGRDDKVRKNGRNQVGEGTKAHDREHQKHNNRRNEGSLR